MKAFGQASTKKILRSRLIWGREVRAGFKQGSVRAAWFQ
jgi:hypothetical protein